MDTPFSIIDDTIFNSLINWSPLTNIVHQDRIMRPDRSVDIRSIESAADLRPKIWILPDSSPIQTVAGSNNLIDLSFKYLITVVQKDANQQDMRQLEYEVQRALLMLVDGAQGNGAPIVNPLPFLFIAPWFKIERVNTLHFSPGTPESWKALFNVTLRAQAERNAVLFPYPIIAQYPVNGLTLVTFNRDLTTGLKDSINWTQNAQGRNYSASVTSVSAGQPRDVTIDWVDMGATQEPDNISYTAAIPDIISNDGYVLAALPFVNYPLSLIM